MANFLPIGWDAECLNQTVVAEDGSLVCSIFSERKKKTVIQFILYRKNKISFESQIIEERYVHFTFNWQANTFAVTTVNHESRELKHPRYDVAFFKMQPENDKNRVMRIGQQSKKPMSRALLASNGVFYALANIEEGPHRGALEFGMFTKNGDEWGCVLIRAVVVSYMDVAEYDASGRFLLTASSSNGNFSLWSSLGELLFKDKTPDKMHAICWRPDPKPFSAKELAGIADQYDQFGLSYRLKDEAFLLEFEKQRNAEKYAKRGQFLAYLKGKRARWAATRAQRVALHGADLLDPANFGSLELECQ